MAKRQIQFTKTCSDCIHESACRIWTDGRFISDTSASVCPNHETVKESSAYLCGVLDERKRKQTNADKIRGSIRAVLFNHGERGYLVQKGDKITQMVVVPVLIEGVELTDTLEETERGAGGFGSTGR